MESFSRYPKSTYPFKLLLVVCVLQAWAPAADANKILFIFPISSKSMSNLFEPLAKGLVERGHEVKLITPVRFNIQSKNLSQLIPYSPEELIRDYPDPFLIRKKKKLYHFPTELLENACHKIYQLDEIKSLANEKFDLIIMNILFHDCFAGLMHKIGSPVIFLSTLPPPNALIEFMGNHFPSSFLPVFPLGDFSASMSFKQRVKNFLYNAYITYLFRSMKTQMEAVYRHHLGSDIPSIDEIYHNQTSMIFTNTHFSVTFPRPLLPSFVEIGGIHCRPPKPLSKDLEEFVSGAKDGVIVFSLGSIVLPSRMPELVRKAFVQSFAKLKQRVLWKWDKEEGMPDMPSNVKLVKWLPQQDLLGHPNVQLFITHGGLLSTEEAVCHGVPVIGMPVFVDQDANMRQAEILGFGIKGEILDLTEKKLTPIIRRILDDPRYMNKAKELSRVFHDQPQTSLEKAIFYVEFVMRHSGAYFLRSSSMNLNRFTYHSVDVVLFLLTVILVILTVTYRIIKFLITGFRPLSSETSEQRRVDRLKKYS